MSFFLWTNRVLHFDNFFIIENKNRKRKMDILQLFADHLMMKVE